MRFGTAGAKDMDKLCALEEKSKRIVKDINRYDKRLPNIEVAEPLRKLLDPERQMAARDPKSS